ncbi:hypothetical protein CGRA01v4_07927 [Colletotrichum graminicola]|nr:hypothetical protein CGRA01v4_07927 [Colletotrichum graminicola]
MTQPGPVSSIYKNPPGFLDSRSHVDKKECDPKSSPVEWLRHVSKPLDFEKTHAESFRIAQRTPKAGRWFLKSTEFEEQWRDGGLRKLWCHGIPGTGKTVLSSIIINHLRARFSSNPEIACVFIYFDHRQHQDHCLTKLLCSMILQLSRGAKHLSAKIQEAHGAWKSTQQMPAERDYLKMLKSQAKGFKRIFFVVDALDECLDDELETNTLNGFLGVCRELPDSFRLLFTSRPVSKFKTLTDPGCELPIAAHDDDISAYLHRFIESRPQLNGIVEKGCKADPSFRAKTLATITDKSHGMQVFLLAHLHIKSLASTHSLAGLKSGLTQLSTSPDDVYATALDRIKKQDRPRRELALKALNWLVNTERQLSVDELTHALAIHNGAEESRSPAWQLPRASDIAGIEDALISACVGIVVVLTDADKKRIVRLTHGTAEEYIKRNQAAVFPDEDSMSPSLLTRTCLYCLAGLPVSTERPTEPRTDDVCREYPLYGYAANFWGLHLDKATGPKGGDLYKLAWRFVSDRPRLDAAVRAMTDPRVAHEANASSVHVAAFFGLEKLVRKAIANGRDINLNAQTRRGETPLHWAATHGRRAFAEFLVREGVELNVPNADRRTALHKAIMGGGDGALVDTILAASGLNLELEDAEGYTCLRWAARYGQLRTVEALLSAGADADAADRDGYTALRWAAHEGYKPNIKALVHSGASVGASGRDGWTLLKWAAQEGQDDMVRFLVKRRADPDAADADGLTALRWAMRYRRATTARLLIQARADVNRPDNQGDQPLYAAVKDCCGPGDGGGGGKASTSLLWLLLESGADVNAQAGGDYGQTPLHLAASAGRGSVVWLLLENGADPRRLDSRNRTPLHCAAASGDVEVCRMLLRKDGDYLVHAADQHGKTPLHVAATEENSNSAVIGVLLEHGADLRRVDSERRTALHCAIRGEHVEVCRALVWNAGEAREALLLAVDDERRSPLHQAASWGNLVVVGMLLDQGASVDARDRWGMTALHVAVSQGYEEVADLLLRSGADVHAVAARRRKRTAMHIAAHLGHVGVVEVLLRHGAVVDARDGGGETPMNLAVAKGHRKVRDFLIERGAEVQSLNGRGLTPVHQQAVPVEAGVTETVYAASEEERVELNGTPIQNEAKSWWKGDRRFAARVEDE